eukprot:gene4329-3143_t
MSSTTTAQQLVAYTGSATRTRRLGYQLDTPTEQLIYTPYRVLEQAMKQTIGAWWQAEMLEAMCQCRQTGIRVKQRIPSQRRTAFAPSPVSTTVKKPFLFRRSIVAPRRSFSIGFASASLVMLKVLSPAAAEELMQKKERNASGTAVNEAAGQSSPHSDVQHLIFIVFDRVEFTNICSLTNGECDSLCVHSKRVPRTHQRSTCPEQDCFELHALISPSPSSAIFIYLLYLCKVLLAPTPALCPLDMTASSSASVFRCAAAAVGRAETVAHFRHNGVIMVENLLEGPLLHRLSAACAEAIVRRGPKVFPAFDPEHSGALQFDMQVKPKAAAKLSELPPPEDLKKVLTNNDAKEALEYHVRRVELKCKTQRRVDRLYRQLVRRRNKFHQAKQIPTVLTAQEEWSGEVSPERMREVEEQFTYQQVKSSFEKYRDDGKMELEIRRENHIDDALQFLENWGRYWIGFWQQLPSDVREALGSTVGSAAAMLSGEVGVRLYSDTLQAFVPFTNGVPFHCAAAGVNFRHPGAIQVFLRLDDTKSSSTGRHVVVPGSHQVVLDLTNDGKDFSRLPMQQVLDAGYLMRHTPDLSALPVTELPAMSPGSAVIMSAYLIHSMLPSFVGSTTCPFVFPTQQVPDSPDVYQLLLMPDRCAFDGQRNSWFSKDSHGPLYHAKKGDLLVDDVAFPLLYKALDVE